MPEVWVIESGLVRDTCLAGFVEGGQRVVCVQLRCEPSKSELLGLRLLGGLWMAGRFRGGATWGRANKG